MFDVRVHTIAEPKNNILAFDSVNINDMFAVNGIRIMDGKNGVFAAIPSAKDKEGKYRDIFHPVTGDSRAQLNNAIVAAYYKSQEKESQEKTSARERLRENKEVTKTAQAPAKQRSTKRASAER